MHDTKNSSGGFISKLRETLDKTWAKASMALGAAAFGFFTYTADVSAENQYNYQMSRDEAAEYRKKHISLNKDGDAFMKIHEMMSEDRKAEESLDEGELDHFMAELNQYIDGKVDNDGLVAGYELNKIEPKFWNAQDYFADFWLGNQDGNMSWKEEDKYESSISQHESLKALDMLVKGKRYCVDTEGDGHDAEDYRRYDENEGVYFGEEEKDDPIYQYAKEHIDDYQQRIIFYEVNKMFDDRAINRWEDEDGKAKSKKEIDKRLKYLADLTDGDDLDIGEDSVGDTEYKELASEIEAIKSQIIDYQVGDKDGSDCLSERGTYDSYSFRWNNLAGETIHKFMKQY